MNLKRTCLITGVAGFIGSHTASLFLEEGIKVIGLDALLPYYDLDMKQGNLEQIKVHPNFTFIQENILDFDFSQIKEPIDYILHLAASPGVRFSSERTQDYIDNNITASLKVLEYAKICRPKRVIIASTSSIYADDQPVPYREDGILVPKAVYGISKWTMEKICDQYRLEYNLPILILRYFSAYGPRQRPDMGIHKFIDKIIQGESIQIYGDGEQSRDFTYVGDVARANLLALKTEKISSDVINIASGKRVTINVLLDMIFQITGKKVEVKYIPALTEESLHTLGAITKAREELGYIPQVSLKEGLLQQWQQMQLRTYK